MNNLLGDKEVRAYTLLTALVICGLAASLVTATKVVHLGISFPFSNIVFSIFTYPIVDCICELWGKRVARQTVWLGLACQLLITILIQLSIYTPAANFWLHQEEYEKILSSGMLVVIAGVLAFSISQFLDLIVYQRIKEWSRGKFLWLRSNISTYLGQIVDSGIFITIVFYNSDQKLAIFTGSILVKMFLSFLMTPIVYLIVITVNRYLDSNTLAFRDESVRYQI
jgi:uncharacterized integral membrane protein (TIGR00697 family)